MKFADFKTYALCYDCLWICSSQMRVNWIPVKWLDSVRFYLYISALNEGTVTELHDESGKYAYQIIHPTNRSTLACFLSTVNGNFFQWIAKSIQLLIVYSKNFVEPHERTIKRSCKVLYISISQLSPAVVKISKGFARHREISGRKFVFYQILKEGSESLFTSDIQQWQM